MPRPRVNLLALPPGPRYAIALAVVAVVVAAAWYVGRDRPTPAWITEWLVPVLGWLFIGLVAVALISRLRRGRPPR